MLQETITALPEKQDLSAVVENYRLLVDNVENMLNNLDDFDVDKSLTIFLTGSFKSHNTNKTVDHLHIRHLLY